MGRLLRCAGLNRLAELEPAPPVLRYEYARPGELLHLDIKKYGRFQQPGHRAMTARQHTSRKAG